jgi:hypothetical protein
VDWHKDPLTPDTVIDGSYRSTANVRRFFAAELGGPVQFTRDFMAWMKSHRGHTLRDAVARLRQGRGPPKAIICK